VACDRIDIVIDIVIDIAGFDWYDRRDITFFTTPTNFWFVTGGLVTMGKRGFSATTAVLVAILIGALYMVGRTVTPPPPGPPEPPHAAKPPADPHATGKGAAPGANAGERAKHMMQEYKKHGVAMKKGAAKRVKKFDPNAIDIVPGWNQIDGREMGESGEKQLSQKVQRVKEEQEAARLHPAAPANDASPKATPQPQVSR